MNLVQLLLKKKEERLGCVTGKLDVEPILSHPFMTKKIACDIDFPKIQFKKGQEIDKAASFTYGVPVIGIELLRDYCWNTNELFMPTKLVAKLKSNRIMYLLAEDETEIKVKNLLIKNNIPLTDIHSLTVVSPMILKLELTSGLTLTLHFMTTLARMWKKKLCSLA